MTDYTSELARELAPGLLERFERYVRVDTQSRRDRTESPSTRASWTWPGCSSRSCDQAGCEDVGLDENGYVTATLPGSPGVEPVVGLIAHMDTSPDAPGAGVEPIVHRDYDGGVIELPRGATRLDPAAMPELSARSATTSSPPAATPCSGLTTRPEWPRSSPRSPTSPLTRTAPAPTLRVCFTPDEEIGEGATLFDIDRLRCPVRLHARRLGGRRGAGRDLFGRSR